MLTQIPLVSKCCSPGEPNALFANWSHLLLAYSNSIGKCLSHQLKQPHCFVGDELRSMGNSEED